MEVVTQSSSVWKGDEWSDLLFLIGVPLETSENGVRATGTKRRSSSHQQHLLRVSATLRVDRGGSDKDGSNTFPLLGTLCEPNGEEDIVAFRFDSDQAAPYSKGLTLPPLTANSFCLKCPVKVHHSALEEAISFSLVVTAQVSSSGNGSKTPTSVRTITGSSKQLKATELALSIEERFSTMPNAIRQKQSTEFVWIDGNESEGIEVAIQLKNTNGDIVERFPEALLLKTELLFDDGLPTQNRVTSQQNRSKPGKPAVSYRPLCPDPILEPHQGTRLFKFRIENPSSSNGPPVGFKLKVAPTDPNMGIHPAVMQETIFIQSGDHRESPVEDSREEEGSMNERITAHERRLSYDGSIERPHSSTNNMRPVAKTASRKFCKMSNTSIANDPLANASAHNRLAVLSVDLLCDSFILPGPEVVCFMCRLRMGSDRSAMEIPSNHRSFCRFANIVLKGTKVITETPYNTRRGTVVSISASEGDASSVDKSDSQSSHSKPVTLVSTDNVEIQCPAVLPNNRDAVLMPPPPSRKRQHKEGGNHYHHVGLVVQQSQANANDSNTPMTKRMKQDPQANAGSQSGSFDEREGSSDSDGEPLGTSDEDEEDADSVPAIVHLKSGRAPSPEITESGFDDTTDSVFGASVFDAHPLDHRACRDGGELSLNDAKDVVSRITMEPV